MSRNHVYSLVLVFVIMGVLGIAITVQRVKATYPIICIRDDGSIDPSYAPIQRDEDIYTLTDDIISEYNGISIERSNIVLNGASHKIQGTVVGPTVGIFLDSGRVNVTVRNVEITDFENGILFYNSSSNCVVGNNITENARFGIQFSQSSGNSIVGNNIIGNNVSGIYLDSPNNLIYHNNFIDNTAQVSMAMAGANVWDDGYPSGGNFWSDYSGVDANGDGIGDTPYVIDANNRDNYPLIHSYGSIRNLNTSLTYLTIQSAINAPETLNGHTIFVRNGTYHENVVVNKTVSLIGKGKDSTILNGTTIEPIMIVEANDVKISGFTFEGWAFQNILINATTGVTIVENKIVFNALGIDVENSVNTTIENNIINGFGLDNIGIMLAYSSGCSIVNNTITNAVYDGIRLWFSSSNLIHQNLIKDNDYGIFFHEANLNTISENTISESGGPGMYIESSSSNEILHNSFMDNYDQVKIYDNSVNTWDSGCEGNYWSDCNGTDLYGGSYQNLTGCDGIGDTPYFIDANSIDNHPLMGMFSDFNATSEYHVQTICNSSISDFQFNGTAIRCNVTGDNDTTGFCRICIPTALMNAIYKVFVNGTEVSYNLLPCSNETYSYLYFNYTHSTQEVIIIPEFPSFLILPLIMIATLLAVIVYRRKHTLDNSAVHLSEIGTSSM